MGLTVNLDSADDKIYLIRRGTRDPKEVITIQLYGAIGIPPQVHLENVNGYVVTSEIWVKKMGGIEVALDKLNREKQHADKKPT